MPRAYYDYTTIDGVVFVSKAEMTVMNDKKTITNFCCWIMKKNEEAVYMHERRECGRPLKCVNVRLYKNDEFISLAETININASGMFIYTDVLLFPRGSMLDISIDAPEELKCDHKTAKIVHRSLDGIGVQFQDEK